MLKMTHEYNDLLDIFKELNFIMINNNLMIKDKVLKKIDMIKLLANSNINVLNYETNKKENLFNILKSINYKLMNVKNKYNLFNNKLNAIFGEIIHNAYISSGYHILISNMPNRATQLNDNKEYIVNAESIYDTLIYYSGEKTDINTNTDTLSLIEVLQIDCDKYLAKFKDIGNARAICNLINKMEVNKNLIRVEMLENFTNFSDINYFNTNENNSENNSNNSISNNISNDISDDKISDYGSGSFSNKYTLLLSPYLKSIYVKGYTMFQYIYSCFITKKM